METMAAIRLGRQGGEGRFPTTRAQRPTDAVRYGGHVQGARAWQLREHGGPGDPVRSPPLFDGRTGELCRVAFDLYGLRLETLHFMIQNRCLSSPPEKLSKFNFAPAQARPFCIGKETGLSPLDHDQTGFRERELDESAAPRRRVRRTCSA
ncbi:hypothetical protein GWI33_006447 [Rhynchophorus ferrugineus]|uniref:Uncharacterized protein n=1 Tax=Rhynchophorus ferrugineus TaxID=354439 RepID=A0A834MIY7_RHYFE|nr:hypothetical protein GWI33_006447 [Rhynchophorus ferrugineus]